MTAAAKLPTPRTWTLPFAAPVPVELPLAVGTAVDAATPEWVAEVTKVRVQEQEGSKLEVV